MIGNVDIDKILLSNKVSLGKKSYKYFIACKYDDYKVNPLCIMLPKMSGYVKLLTKLNIYIYIYIFKIKNDEFLKYIL